VSVIRWRAGESAIWLRISASTSEWVDLNGALTAPSPEHPAAFTIGDSEADAALIYDDLYEQRRANLPNYFQWLQEASTEIYLDLASPVFSGLPLLKVAFEAYDGSGSNVGWFVPENHIVPGMPLGTAFFGDDIIAVLRP